MLHSGILEAERSVYDDMSVICFSWHIICETEEKII